MIKLKNNWLKVSVIVSLVCFTSFAQSKRIVCVGAHPDDPESGMGGTIAKYISEGHQVTIIYLTTGEAGIPELSHKKAAEIRKKEAECANEVLGTKSIFLGQIDGATEYTRDWEKKLEAILGELKPDIVYTHWPIDSHRDHQIASLLTFENWIKMDKGFDLYYFEVCANSQTMGFNPTDYVDITSFQEIKKRAVDCHVSQDPEAIYFDKDCNHFGMQEGRGKEIGVEAAEAFIKLN
jgi:LmbE family N-acetylglucosaminyl deacetylase